MEDLQLLAQKQRLDHAMCIVQIILDEMGLDEHEDVQTAFNALACTLDEVVN